MGGNVNGNGNDNGKGKEHPLESNNNLIPPPPPHTPQPCPRCFSTTTKFCYYNNRSVSQPRYFCKSCKRHWTLGGALRNVPIGGGCRTGTKKTLKGDHYSGCMTSCSSLDKGESSRVQKHLSPPQQTQPPLPMKPQPLLAHMNDISNMNFSFVDSFTLPGGISAKFASMQNLNLTQGFNQVPSIGGSNIGDVGGIQGSCSTNDILLNGSSSKPNLTRPPHIQLPVNQFNNGQQAIAQPSRTIDSLTQALTSHPAGSNINPTWIGSNNITGSGFVMNNQNQWSDEYYVDNVDAFYPGSSPFPPY